MEQAIEIPRSWERIKFEELHGPLMVIGMPDSGKSTFARYLYSRLSSIHEKVAFVDGDVGQSTMGPPTTMTLVMEKKDDGNQPADDIIYRVFVGATSPRGHMLQTVVGLHKLVRKACNLGASAVVVDTTGLVGAEQGGGILKLSKVDLLEPKTVFAIHRDRELDHIIIPLRKSSRASLVELSPVSSVKPRDFAARRAHRVSAFKRYFANASLLEIRWTEFAVIPAPYFYKGRLVSLENARGFSLGLGVVIDVEPSQHRISIITPLNSFDQLDTLKLGNLCLDPRNFEERRRWEILEPQEQNL